MESDEDVPVKEKGQQKEDATEKTSEGEVKGEVEMKEETDKKEAQDTKAEGSPVAKDEAATKEEEMAQEGETVVQEGAAAQGGEEDKKAKKKRLKAFYKTISEQMEFYFSDSNLYREGFLMKEIEKSPDGWVDLKMFLSFNKIKEVTNDVSAVAHALRKSELLEVDSEKMCVRRKTPYQEPKDLDDRTVYVENLPPNVNHLWIRQKFAKCGKILYISIPRFKSTNDPKGFAFIEFETIEAAAEAVKTLNNPKPEKKPGMFPKGNKTLDALRRKAGAQGDAGEQGSAKEKGHRRGKEQSGPGGDDSHKSGSTGSSHKRKRKESVVTDEEGMEVGDGSKTQEAGGSSSKKRRGSHSEGEDPPAKKVRKHQGEGEVDGTSGKKRKKKAKGEEEVVEQGDDKSVPSRKRKHEEQVEVAKGEDRECTEQEESSPEEECPPKRARSKSEPALPDVDSADEPPHLSRQQSDPGKASAEEEKVGTKSKKKKKKKKKHKHPDGKKHQEEDAGKAARPEERPARSEGGSRAAGGKGDKRKRKHMEVEVTHVAPKILKSAIMSDRPDRPPKKVTIKLAPPEELKAKEKEKENKKVANGEPEKKKTRRKVKPTAARKDPAHLRVMPKKEWMKLREEYKELQKKEMKTLKEQLKEMPVPETHRDPGEAPTFVPDAIISVQCPDFTSRKRLLKVIGEDVEVAYIDLKEGSNEGFIRCKDSENAEKIMKKASEEPEYTFEVLKGEKEQEYWQKLTAQRAKKYERESIVESRRGGKKRFVKKVKKLSIAAKERKHIIFDED